MNAFFITEAGETEIRQIPTPSINADEVLLRVKVVGFCGSDLNTYRGLNPMVQYPCIPGHEIGGTIEAVGERVPPEWSPGLDVTLSPYTSCGSCSACLAKRPNCCRNNQTMGVQRAGAMTEYIAVPWSKLFRSDKLSLRELALVEPLTVGGHAAARGGIQAEETVCVLGCGAIGLGAIAGATFRGARVIAVDIDDEKLATARRVGAVETINSISENLHERLQVLTNGQGPSVIIEAIGLPLTFRQAVEEVCFAGRVVYIGYAKKPVEYETKLFVQKELDIRGSRNALPENFADVIAMLETGSFPLDAVVTRIVPLEQAGQALADWNDNPPSFTKILVEI